ncbi:tetratricopeptide repeat protein [Robertkochia flava]|uniref:tetratricopeptide repeat protein n=1 Tax=Robertkochia flava TaxID=3447986 RepID=UPI001CC99866|nr:hypothetical protein [Robertkochia marina]
MKYFLTFLCLGLMLSCNQKNENRAHQLGVVNLEVSGNEAAKAHFKKGLLLLHSFEYTDAREAFEAAETADPDMAMAYWGQAMTFNHSIWFEQDFEQATACLDRMHNRAGLKADSDLEKSLINAVELLYQKEKPKPQRDLEYSAYLGDLHEQFPENQEITAFYALSLLGTVSEGRDYEIYGKAAEMAKKVLKSNPEHPGALHYLIHSYDDPDHARLALEAADAYAIVAPDAAHALHMPSHIYVAMGMWDKVVASNEDSYGASLNRMERKKLSNDARGYHSFHWLQYGYLQQGRAAEAATMALNLNDYIKETPSKRGRSHLVFLKGTYLVESGDWQHPVAEIPVEVEDLNIVVRGQYAFTEGMQAFSEKNKEKLASTIADLEKSLNREAVLVDNLAKGYSGCTNLDRETANKTDLQLTQVMIWQLKALQAWLSEDTPKTESFLRQAVTLEDQISYSYGPPVIQKPAHELYADWLLAQNRNGEALQEYKHTLKKAPKRSRSLKGAMEAAISLENDELALKFNSDLQDNLVSSPGPNDQRS